jgi:hypothetical protein
MHIKSLSLTLWVLIDIQTAIWSVLIYAFSSNTSFATVCLIANNFNYLLTKANAINSSGLKCCTHIGWLTLSVSILNPDAFSELPSLVDSISSTVMDPLIWGNPAILCSSLFRWCNALFCINSSCLLVSGISYYFPLPRDFASTLIWCIYYSGCPLPGCFFYVIYAGTTPSLFS